MQQRLHFYGCFLVHGHYNYLSTALMIPDQSYLYIPFPNTPPPLLLSELKFATSEEASHASSAAKRQEDGGGGPRDSETLIINTVYGWVGDVARSRDTPKRGRFYVLVIGNH